MRITIALPFLNRTGGVRALLDLANALHDRGHEMCVVAPLWPYPFHHRRSAALRDQLTRWRRGEWPWLQMRCAVRRVPWLHDRFLPAADLVIGTSWPLIEDMARLTASRGRKVHVVFHHEADTGDPRRVAATYRLPCFRIAVSRTVRDELTHRWGCRVHAHAALGIDRTTFHPEGDREERSVLWLYHDAPRKGAGDAIRAVHALTSAWPGVSVRICGTVPPRSVPPYATFELDPDDATLRRRYAAATAVLYPSRYEGFGLPPLEAMSCGTPVVTTAVGAVAEYAVSGHNAIVVDPGDVAAMTRGLRSLLADPALAARLGANGLETARAYDWPRVVPAFEAALRSALATDSTIDA